MNELENYVNVQQFMSRDDYKECIKIFNNIDNAKNQILTDLEEKSKYIDDIKNYSKSLDNIYLHPIKKGAC